MFNPRKTSGRRCSETRRLPERCSHKRRKVEGNSNITSNRVTIPPGFLCHGVGSGAVHKTPNHQNFDPENDLILKEDLHGLINNNLKGYCRKLRSSSRNSKSTTNSRHYNNLTASEYYYKDFKTENSSYQVGKEPIESPCRSNCVRENKSKSIFRKINERCARAQAKNSNSFVYSIRPIIDSESKVEHFQASSFCFNLAREIFVDINQTDYVLRTKLAIADKIRSINQQLLGKMSSNSTAMQRSHEKMDTSNEPSKETEFKYIPKCEWIFETPPRQRVSMPKIEECSIQPAVLCTVKKQSNIYELNPNIRVDLMQCSNRQNVPVDGRYLQHLASFDNSVEPGLSFGHAQCSNRDDSVDDYGAFKKQKIGNEFSFFNPPSTISQHFSRVACRPTKTVKKMSRLSGFNSRNEGELGNTPTGSNLFQTMEEFERDYTFVEDEGKYRIINTQSSKTESTSQLDFKFRKNLFKDENLFNFDKDESKMFDFARLKE